MTKFTSTGGFYITYGIYINQIKGYKLINLMVSVISGKSEIDWSFNQQITSHEY